MKERHFLFPMLDGWTNVFQVPGNRNTGTKAQTYAITGPGWTGKLPAGVTEYKSPTGLVWILGRIYSSGPPADYKEVHALQDKVSVVPLSAYEKPYSPAPGTVDPAIDMAGAPKPAQELIMGGLKGGTVAGDSKLENGWLFSTKVGQYGTSYVQRALVTAIGLGANRPEVAVYPTSKGPDIAARYSGEKKYVMHFEKGQQPPVNGFWSLTRYDSDYFFFDSMRNDRLSRGAQPSIVATFPHEGPSEAPGVDIMNHPNTLSVAQSHGGQDQRGAGGAVGSSAWRALQKLLAGLCEPAQSTCRNPAAYPATFINLP